MSTSPLIPWLDLYNHLPGPRGRAVRRLVCRLRGHRWWYVYGGASAGMGYLEVCGRCGATVQVPQ